MGQSSTTATPLALTRAIDVDAICRENPCDSITALGSFWPYSKTSFESRLVKAFKECRPAASFEPHVSELCCFYAGLIHEAAGQTKIDWVVRVLSSSEAKPEPDRPQRRLEQEITARTGAKSATDVFFRSGSRPPMRSVPRLSGPDALARRVRYLAQDLFVRSADLGGTVLLIDDILNTGASMRVWAFALKEFCGVEKVIGVNLAATRFNRGKDGHGMLKLNLTHLPGNSSLSQAWVGEDGVFHSREECPAIQQVSSCEPRFVAERKATPCPECCEREKPKRKWWQIFG